MALPSEYAAAAKAAAAIIQRDISDRVPFFMRSQIPSDLPQTLGAEVAKASVDAVDAIRNAAKTPPSKP